jgi:hypothetical protein
MLWLLLSTALFCLTLILLVIRILRSMSNDIINTLKNTFGDK